MKRVLLAHVIIASLLIGACGAPAATPTANLPESQNTATPIAIALASATQEPTNTVPPPTETASPTETALPAPTMELPTIIPTLQTTPDLCNHPLASWQGPSASFSIDTEYTPRQKDDKVIVSFWVMTANGECGFLSDTTNGPIGQYTVVAYIDGKRDFKVSGMFRITEGSWKIVIRNDTLVALGGCYPHC